jgi:hypothetical protein
MSKCEPTEAAPDTKEKDVSTKKRKVESGAAAPEKESTKEQTADSDKVKIQFQTAMELAQKALKRCATKEDVLELAQRFYDDLGEFLEANSARVCYVACQFGTKGRYGHVAWWYKTSDTLKVEEWLENEGLQAVGDGAEFHECSKMEFDAIEWRKHRLACSGGLSEEHVTEMGTLEEIKRAFLDTQWNETFSEGGLTRMFLRG